MKWNAFKGEAGFWSSVFLVLMVSLGTMALSAYYMMNREGENAVNSTVAMQVDYSATGAAYWAIGAIRDSVLISGSTADVTISGIPVDVALNQVTNNEGRSIYRLDIQSNTEEGVSRKIEIDLNIPRSISQFAIAAEGDVDDDITPYDENHNIDWDLIQENTDLPEIDLASLLGHAVDTITDAKDLQDGWKAEGTPAWADSIDEDPFFYWKDGVKIPHIIYVDDDPVKFYANQDYYGIFVVNGNVRIQSGHTEIHGVILQLDPTDTITEEDVTLYGTTSSLDYKFKGGVYSYGSVHANGNPLVQHNPVYTKYFAQYCNENLRNRILSWKYK
jgi:hypothetical protein